LLLIEDDLDLADLLTEYLEQNGFSVEHRSRGDDAERAIQRVKPDLMILDLMLPGANGLDVLRSVRADFSGAIVMLTASQSEVDHVTGLELGADDFVVKPIDPRVLLARIRSQLRRLGAETDLGKPSGLFEIGPLRIDSKTREVTCEGEPVTLTTMEFDVIEYLAQRAGTVVDRESLYRDIMETEYDGIDRGMDVHVSRVRKKLSECGFDASRIKSVRGVGYLLAIR
jgi:two-component system OmpR family response regulator/two-component system response regulator RstA